MPGSISSRSSGASARSAPPPERAAEYADVSLVELVERLRERAASESQQDLLAWLRAFAAYRNIHITVSPIVAPAEEGSADEGESASREDAPKTSAYGRAILAARGRRVNNGDRLRAECNGAIIDVRTWTLLATPNRAFPRQPPQAAINRALAVPDADGVIRTGLYKIFRINDGTFVTIYRWMNAQRRHVWCIGTAKGYDVSNLCWFGTKTYAEVLYESLCAVPGFAEATGLELVEDLSGATPAQRISFDPELVDPSRSYTLIFRHHDHHLLRHDPAGIWNIHTADSRTGEITYASDTTTGLPLIPNQVAMTREEIIGHAEKLGRSGVGADGSALRFADLEFILQHALVDAKRAISSSAASDSAASDSAASAASVTPAFNYGFVLRSTDISRTGPVSDVICDSPLLTAVRSLIYAKPSSAHAGELTETTRVEYNSLRAYVNAHSNPNGFLELFPHFKSQFAQYDAFFDKLVRDMNMLHRARTAQGGQAPPLEDLEPRDQLIEILLKSVVSRAFSEDFASTLRDHVMSVANVPLYLRIIEK